MTQARHARARVIESFLLSIALMLVADAALAAIEEIVVTATKRETDLQDTPASITALTSKELEQRGIVDTDSLQYQVPGLYFGKVGGAAQYAIRGVGAEWVGGAPGVALHIDGIFVGRDIGAVLPYYDVERVEVLRGPQGTLYGRNTTAGVINLILKRPTPDFELQADALYGNYDATELRAAVGGPITSDKRLMGRLSFTYSDRDGYVDNLYDGSTQSDQHYYTGRLAFLWEPSETLDIYLSASTYDSDAASVTGKLLTPYPPLSVVGIDLTTFTPILANRFATAAGNPPDPREVRLNDHPSVDASSDSVTLEIDKDFGQVRLVSLTGYMKLDTVNRNDADGSELFITRLDYSSLAPEQWSQEFRLSGGTGPLEWLLGAYWFSEDADEGYLQTDSVLGPTSIPYVEKTDAYAAFANVSFAIGNRVRLNGGVRYSYEDKKLDLEILFPSVPPIPAGPPVSGVNHGNWDATTWQAGVDYQVADDNLLYFTASSGFKSGGLPTFSVTAPPFSPEHNTAYEIGSKNRFLDARLQINLAAFIYDYSDLQVFNIDPVLMTVAVENAAKSTVQGGEVEFVASVTENFQLDGSLSLLDATYDEFISNGIDVSGNHMSRAPDATFRVGAQYLFNLGNLGTLTPRIDYFWSDEVYFSATNLPDQRQGSYHTTNVRVSWVDQTRRLYGEAFVSNLEDDDVLQNIISNGAERVGYYAPPRTYGLRLGVRF